MEGRSDQNQISAVSEGESNLTEWRQVLTLLVLTKIHQLSEKSFIIYIYMSYMIMGIVNWHRIGHIHLLGNGKQGLKL